MSMKGRVKLLGRFWGWEGGKLFVFKGKISENRRERVWGESQGGSGIDNPAQATSLPHGELGEAGGFEVEVFAEVDAADLGIAAELHRGTGGG